MSNTTDTSVPKEILDVIQDIPDEVKEESRRILKEGRDRIKKAVDGRIRLIDKTGKFLVPVAIEGFPEEEENIYLAVRELDDCIAGRVARTGVPENSTGLQEDTDFIAFLKKVKEKGKKDENWKKYAERFEKIQSEVAVPLEVHGNVIGIFNVHSTEKNAFTEEDKKTLYDLARLTGTAIANARLFVAFKQMVSKFTPAVNPDDILNSIPRIVCDLMNTPACSIWLLDEATKEIKIRASHGLDKEYTTEAILTLADEVTGKAIRTKYRELVPDIAKGKEKLQYPEGLLKRGFKSLLSVPLTIDGEKAIGTINIYTPATKAKQELTEHEIKLLEIFAVPAAAILKGAKLNRLREDIIEDILKISSEEYDLEKLLKEIAKIGKNHLEVKSCAIFLLEADNKTLRIRAGEGEDIGEKLMASNATYYVPDRPSFKDLEERRSKINGNLMRKKRKEELLSPNKWENRKKLIKDGKLPMGITAWIIKEKKPRLLSGDEVRNHPEWFGGYEKKQGEECMSLVEIPLIFSDGNVGGIIKIENHIHGKRFTKDHLEILSILGKYVVLAIERVMRTPISYRELYGDKLLEKIKSLKVD